MTILNLPDRTTPPDQKIKAKIKVKLGGVVVRCLVYSVTADCSRRLTAGIPKAPLGSEDAVFHYSANFFTVMIFTRGISHLFLPRSATCG
jgi:hypothetical protein